MQVGDGLLPGLDQLLRRLQVHRRFLVRQAQDGLTGGEGIVARVAGGGRLAGRLGDDLHLPVVGQLARFGRGDVQAVRRDGRRGRHTGLEGARVAEGDGRAEELAALVRDFLDAIDLVHLSGDRAHRLRDGNRRGRARLERINIGVAEIQLELHRRVIDQRAQHGAGRDLLVRLNPDFIAEGGGRATLVVAVRAGLARRQHPSRERRGDGQVGDGLVRGGHALLRLGQRGLRRFQLLAHIGRVDLGQNGALRNRVARLCVDGEHLALQVLAQLGTVLGGGHAAALDVGLEHPARGEGRLFTRLLSGRAGRAHDPDRTRDERGQQGDDQTDAHRPRQTAAGTVHLVGIFVAHRRVGLGRCRRGGRCGLCGGLPDIQISHLGFLLSFFQRV